MNYNYDPTRHTIGVSLPFCVRDWVFEQKKNGENVAVHGKCNRPLISVYWCVHV